jgi:hypothetical protein
MCWLVEDTADGKVITPTEPFTDSSDADPTTDDHVPPTSAAPHPLETVRVNVSDTRAFEAADALWTEEIHGLSARIVAATKLTVSAMRLAGREARTAHG